jgi:hypothetical protein
VQHLKLELARLGHPNGFQRRNDGFRTDTRIEAAFQIAQGFHRKSAERGGCFRALLLCAVLDPLDQRGGRRGIADQAERTACRSPNRCLGVGQPRRQGRNVARAKFAGDQNALTNLGVPMSQQGGQLGRREAGMTAP